MRPRPLAALLAPLAVAAAACAMGGGRRGAAATDANSATLEVRSNFIGPVDIYAVTDNGFSQRVASQVTSGRPARFRLGPSIIGGAGAVRIVAFPLAENGRASTGLITVRPGDVVQFNIAPDLVGSSVFIR